MMDLDGTANDATMTMSGSGKDRRVRHDHQQQLRYHFGLRNIETFVSNHLDATISGSGTIRYRGNLRLRRISGSGSVVRVP